MSAPRAEPTPTPSAAAPPRIWPSIAVSVGVIPAALLVSLIATTLYVLVLMAMGESPPVDDEVWMQEKMGTPLGFLAFLLPGQCVVLVLALLGAALSPTPMRERLGLVGGDAPVWLMLLCAAAMPFLSFVGSMFSSILGHEPSANIEALYVAFQTFPAWFVVIAALVVSVVPGFGEELLFRGYIQTRLLERWAPWWAIGFSTLMFSVLHIYPQHILGVIPIGAWIGVVAWRSRSLWPAIVCHIANNLYAAIIMSVSDDRAIDAPFWDLYVSEIVVIATSGAAFFGAAWGLKGRSATPPA